MQSPSTRQTHFIERRQGSVYLNASGFAAAIGRPLNTHVTLNFAHTDAQAERVSKLFERLRDNHFTRWLRYLCQRDLRSDYAPPTYTWVVENSGGHTHVHWAVHLPKDLQAAFQVKLRDWLARVAGDYLESAIKVGSIYGAGGLAAYCMKGLHPSCAAKYQIRHKPQGLVYGKRCGVSENLGPAARKRHRRAAADLAVDGLTRAPNTAGLGAAPL